MKPLFAVMFASLAECTFLGMGVPVIPLFVSNILHYGAGMVGVVTGIQFITAMIFRFPAGRLSDVKGPYFAMSLGALGGVIGGMLYFISGLCASLPPVSVSILLIGSAFLGLSQSVLVTGAMTCGVSIVQAEQQKQIASESGSNKQGTGSAIAWIGMCVFGGLILGAPLGTYLFQKTNLPVTGAVIALLSGFVMLYCQKKSQAWRRALSLAFEKDGSPQGTSNFFALKESLKVAFFPGFCFGLCAVSHGLILAYGSLLFATHGWEPLWLPFAVFAVALIGARMFFKDLPDEWGGPKTAFAAGVWEAAGLVLMVASSNFYLVTLGIFLTGFGFAFTFPAFVLITLKRGNVASRGVLIGVCNALGDGVRGAAIVLLGYLAIFGGFRTIFLSGAGLSLLGALGGLSLLFVRKKLSFSAMQKR